MEKRMIQVPFVKEELENLKSGDYIYLTGTIYTARDAAHKRLYESMLKGEELPIALDNNIIYYLGPSPARPGQVIGSAGPTTSSRMDKYTPLMLDAGLKGMIGKGKRNQEVIDSIVKNGAVYMAAVGGAGALLSKCIKESEILIVVREVHKENALSPILITVSGMFIPVRKLHPLKAKSAIVFVPLFTLYEPEIELLASIK